MVVAVSQTMLVPLIGDLPALLATSSTNATWVLTATLLAGAVSTPVLGRLGDMFGKRRLMLVALGLMIGGSLVCAVSSSLTPMVVGRALQGCAMGAIPLGISIMRDTVAPRRLSGAMGFMSSSLGIGGALGLPIAALVAERSDWHVLFYGAAALTAVVFVLLLLAVPPSPTVEHGRFDVVGAIGLSAGLICLLLAISKGGDWGWASARTIGLFAGAAVIFTLWGVLQLRIDDPLVDLRVTARRQVLVTNIASILVGFSFYAMQLVPTQLLQLPTTTGYGLGASMLTAGLCVAPTGVLMMLVSPVGARLTSARGPKTSLLVGLAVLGSAYAVGQLLLDEVWKLSLLSALIGVGVGIAYGAMPALIVAAVPRTETAAANGLNTLMRSLGTSTCSAVIGAVLAHLTVQSGAASVPSLDAFRIALLLACGASVAGMLVAACIPTRRHA